MPELLTPGPGRRDVVVWRNELLPGTETFILNQAAALRRWHPRFAGLRASPGPLQVDPALVVGTGPLGGLRLRSMRTRRRSKALARLLRSPSVGVVHAHFGVDGVTVAPEAERAGLPLVVSFHGYDVTRLPDDPVVGPRYRELLAELFAQAGALLAASDFVAVRLRALGAPEQKVVRHDVDIRLAPFRPPPPARRILFVGRMVELKGRRGPPRRRRRAPSRPPQHPGAGLWRGAATGRAAAAGAGAGAGRQVPRPPAAGGGGAGPGARGHLLRAVERTRDCCRFG